MTTVINITTTKYKYDVYIGRPRLGQYNIQHFGNPFSHRYSIHKNVKQFNTREEAIEAFREWILGTKYQDIEPLRRQWILMNVSLLKDKVLGCFCKPQSCHGDILIELAEGKLTIPINNP